MRTISRRKHSLRSGLLRRQLSARSQSLPVRSICTFPCCIMVITVVEKTSPNHGRRNRWFGVKSTFSFMFHTHRGWLSRAPFFSMPTSPHATRPRSGHFSDCFTEDASLLPLYHGVKKSKMTKNPNQRRGSCLKLLNEGRSNFQWAYLLQLLIMILL